MPAIRRRYNSGSFVLAPHVISNSKPIVGQSVEVVLKDMSLKNIHFVGFVTLGEANLLSGQWVEITGLIGFNIKGELLGDWVDLPQDGVFLGRYCSSKNGVYAVIQNNSLISVR